MKNALMIVWGFMFGLLVAAGLSTTNLFSDASKSNGLEIIAQVDQILEQPKFDNIDYIASIVDKTEVVIELFPEGSTEQLVIMYIHEVLKAKHKKLVAAQPAPVPVEVVEDVVEEVVIENQYHAVADKFPKLAEEEIVKDQQPSEIGFVKFGRQEAPEKVVEAKVKKNYATPDFKYIVDGKTHDSNCVQLETLQVCMEYHNHDSSKLANCRTQSIAGECLNVKARWALQYKMLEFANPGN